MEIGLGLVAPLIHFQFCAQFTSDLAARGSWLFMWGGNRAPQHLGGVVGKRV